MNLEEPERQTQLLGLWDLSTEPFTLGGMFNLMAELRCRTETHLEIINGVCLLWDTDHPLPSGIPLPASPEITLLSPNDLERSPVIATMMEFENVDNCYAAGSLADVQAFVQTSDGNYRTWPSSDTSNIHLNHEYPSTRHIQHFSRQHSYVPRIKLRPGPLERARALLRDTVPTGRPVIVHVKSDSQNREERDASINEWAEFIRGQVNNSETTFIAIGNDDVEPLRNLPNVIVARDSGNDLPRDLALIQIGAAFMGLASGPAQLAILGDRPYAVFKPMNIHPEFMKREIGDLPGFPFATTAQHLFRTDPTRENLTDAFDIITVNMDDSEPPS